MTTARRGEVYEVDFGVGVGREVSGTHPAVVVSDDPYNVGPFSLVVIPSPPLSSLYTYRALGVPVTAAESGMPRDAIFLCYLIRAVDPSRVGPNPVGQLPAARMADIDRILRSILYLHPPTASGQRPSAPPP